MPFLGVGGWCFLHMPFYIHTHDRLDKSRSALEGSTAKNFGLKKVRDISQNILPQDMQNKFTNQILFLCYMYNKVHNIVKTLCGNKMKPITLKPK